MGRLFAVILGALVLAGAAGGPAADARAQEKKPTIALIPGLTTDTFHITMRKGAERAAKALGVNYLAGLVGMARDASGADRECVDRPQARRHPHRPDRQGAADRAAESRPCGGLGDHPRHVARPRCTGSNADEGQIHQDHAARGIHEQRDTTGEGRVHGGVRTA